MQLDNYFKVFDIDIAFNIDIKNLEAKYFLLYKNHINEHSNLEIINKAYNTLSTDLERAIYILEFNNIKWTKIGVLPMELLESLHTRAMLIQDEKSDIDLIFTKNNQDICLVITKMQEAFLQKDFKLFSILTAHLKYLDRIKQLLKEKAVSLNK